MPHMNDSDLDLYRDYNQGSRGRYARRSRRAHRAEPTHPAGASAHASKTADKKDNTGIFIAAAAVGIGLLLFWPKKAGAATLAATGGPGTPGTPGTGSAPFGTPPAITGTGGTAYHPTITGDTGSGGDGAPPTGGGPGPGFTPTPITPITPDTSGLSSDTIDAYNRGYVAGGNAASSDLATGGSSGAGGTAPPAGVFTDAAASAFSNGYSDGYNGAMTAAGKAKSSGGGSGPAAGSPDEYTRAFNEGTALGGRAGSLDRSVGTRTNEIPPDPSTAGYSFSALGKAGFSAGYQSAYIGANPPSGGAAAGLTFRDPRTGQVRMVYPPPQYMR